MAKRTAPAQQPPAPSVTDLELVLESKPQEVLKMVREGKTDLIPTRTLNIFYVQADVIAKQAEDLKKRTRDTVISRRNEGAPAGEKGQHREFAYNTPHGRIELTVQERRSWKPNPEKLVALLHEKKLWDQAINLKVLTSGDGFQKFLRKYRKEINALGIVIEEELDDEKVDGLCKAKLITPEELDAILDKPDPTYALVGKLKT
jgi:hypothetical protein